MQALEVMSKSKRLVTVQRSIEHELIERGHMIMTSPNQPFRRDIRYALRLHVTVRLADREMHRQSENIGLCGILLSSAILIPEGSTRWKWQFNWGASSTLTPS